MKVKVSFFGHLSEITGREFYVSDVKDSLDLSQNLNSRFPQLARHRYAVALNRKIIRQNTPLADGDEVALLPPFSGG